MGYYNSGSETNLPYAAQPPAQYDQDYMRRLIGTINRLVQFSGDSSQVPATVITSNVAVTISSLATGSNAIAATLSVPGVNIPNPVAVSVSPALPAGVFAIGKVSANDTVKVEIYNQSGSSFSGPVTVSVAVITNT